MTATSVGAGRTFRGAWPSARGRKISLAVAWFVSSLAFVLAYLNIGKMHSYWSQTAYACDRCERVVWVCNHSYRIDLSSRGTDDAGGCVHLWRSKPRFLSSNVAHPLALTVAFYLWLAATAVALRARYARRVLIPRRAVPWLVLACAVYILVHADLAGYMRVHAAWRDFQAARIPIPEASLTGISTWRSAYIWHACATVVALLCAALGASLVTSKAKGFLPGDTAAGDQSEVASGEACRR
ncbi:MAG: hypothetical protein ACYTFI_16965 [Planctomycetota bacterium]